MRGSFLRDIALFLVNSELDYLFDKFSMLFFLSLYFVIYFVCACVLWVLLLRVVPVTGEGKGFA